MACVGVDGVTTKGVDSISICGVGGRRLELDPSDVFVDDSFVGSSRSDGRFALVSSSSLDKSVVMIAGIASLAASFGFDIKVCWKQSRREEEGKRKLSTLGKGQRHAPPRQMFQQSFRS